MNGNPLFIVIWLVFLIGVMYFVMIRPQQRRMQAHRALMSQVAPGDKIVTIGGMHGQVVSVTDDTIEVEIASGTVITLNKGAVATRVQDEKDAISGASDADGEQA